MVRWLSPSVYWKVKKPNGLSHKGMSPKICSEYRSVSFGYRNFRSFRVQFFFQIAGSWPDELSKVAELTGEFLNVDFIDINCGCPIDLLCNHGSGCKLATKPDRLCNAIKVSFRSGLNSPANLDFN